jgi:hypothetical protein
MIRVNVNKTDWIPLESVLIKFTYTVYIFIIKTRWEKYINGGKGETCTLQNHGYATKVNPEDMNTFFNLSTFSIKYQLEISNI